VCLLMTLGCSRPTAPSLSLDELADRYVRLVLAAGAHDPRSVDAFYGPPEWQVAATRQGASLTKLRSEASDLWQRLRRARAGEESRLRYLDRQIVALATRLQMLSDGPLEFDEEAARLFGMIPPPVAENRLEPLVKELDSILPGPGPLTARLESFDRRTAIPPERLPRLVEAALNACRSRTLALMQLPQGERVTVAFVRHQPWAAYARYKGRFETLIEINDAMPRRPDEVLDLMCHEGYPGHHAQYTLVESKLVNERGWRERQVQALFSPASAEVASRAAPIRAASTKAAAIAIIIATVAAASGRVSR